MKDENTGKRIIPVILILGIWLMLAQTVAAAQGTELTLTVWQEFELLDQNTAKFNNTGTYQFSPVSPEAPMPEGSKKEGFLFSLKGSREKQEIPLKFRENGTFVYTLLQTTEDRKNYSYDRNVYTITVYVRSSEKGETVSQVIVENKSGEKCGEIKFQNSFKGKEKPVSPVEENHSSRKDSVKTLDSSNVGFWLILGAASLTAGLYLWLIKRTHRE